jgi:hypothetical protein
MNKLIIIVLAFTVFACTKKEDTDKKFDVVGKWKTDVFYDKVLDLDSAVDVYEFQPNLTYVRRLYREGSLKAATGGDYTITANKIVFKQPFQTEEKKYLIADNNTMLLQYDDSTWISARRQ